MSTPKTTQKTDHLVTLTSGLFLVAVLVAAAGFLGFNPISVTETAAQNTVLQNQSASFVFLSASSSSSSNQKTASITSSATSTGKNTPFYLSWEVENANNAIAFSDDSSYWDGQGNLGVATGTMSISESNVGTYVYGVQGTGNGPLVEDTVSVDVILIPDYGSSFEPDGTIDLDGEPGSTASIVLRIQSIDGYSGDVDVSINPDDVTPSIVTTNGDMINFSVSPSTVSVPAGGSATTSIDMETLLPIRDDQDYDVTVRMYDADNNVAPGQSREKFTTFIINGDAFAPRTIEEF